ncbi:hypothetical protein AVEN_196618-1 [Araneus ventricosus]|uniref:MATH domain-containing protein n=1 Tax=Araneus ventricosus TaxID=182803 RepID=A0A4Y2GSC0_ARAVE|nr:hypothetical protein AVEN_196618-1 [Araneus ventricosus]
MKMDSDEESEQQIYEGHYVHYKFSPAYLDITERWFIRRQYHTNCRFMNTCWLLEMIFQLKPEAENVSCSIKLYRSDSMNDPVRATVWVSFYEVDARSPFISQDFRKKQIFSGEKLEGCIAEIVPEEKSITHEELVVRVSIYIRCSHPEYQNNDVATIVGTKKSERKGVRSKM